MQTALRRVNTLPHGQNVDKFVPYEQSVEELKSIEIERDGQIAALDHLDDAYFDNVDQINKKFDSQRF